MTLGTNERVKLSLLMMSLGAKGRSVRKKMKCLTETVRVRNYRWKKEVAKVLKSLRMNLLRSLVRLYHLREGNHQG